MQIRLHWAVVGLVAVQFLFHDGMVHAFRELIDTQVQNFSAGVIVHIAAGLVILVLTFWRIGLKMLHGGPVPDASHSPAQVMVARVTYGLFYLLLVLLPVSGMVAWSQGSGLAGNVHGALRVVLFLLIVVHVAAALMGQFVRKDGTMTRMVKPID
ncbi:cytochrome b [Rhodovulum euryhalinum]|nr:cytochrome b/b6 domain-containing protein [Rhodovulum euryhalinum]